MELNISDCYRVTYLDPAGARQTLKKVRARSAIVTIAMDSLERVFVLSTWAGRERTEGIIQKLLQEHRRWKPNRVGVEANAMQALFAESVEYILKLQQQRLPIIPWQQPTRIDKDFRIRTVIQPVIATGRLFTLEGQTELESEIRSFPTGNLKDIIDALASAIAMCPARTADWQEEEEERLQVELTQDFYGYNPSGFDPYAPDDFDGEDMPSDMDGLTLSRRDRLQDISAARRGPYH